jgi:hypothetical protein
MIVKEALRQTGGSCEVASGGAVLDADRRLPRLLRRTRALLDVSHVVISLLSCRAPDTGAPGECPMN